MHHKRSIFAALVAAFLCTAAAPASAEVWTGTTGPINTADGRKIDSINAAYDTTKSEITLGLTIWSDSAWPFTGFYPSPNSKVMYVIRKDFSPHAIEHSFYLNDTPECTSLPDTTLDCGVLMGKSPIGGIPVKVHIEATISHGPVQNLSFLNTGMRLQPPPPPSSPPAPPAPAAPPVPLAPPTQPQGVRLGAICKDGWHSTSTGSGTCSSHGGVAYWLYANGSTPAPFTAPSVYTPVSTPQAPQLTLTKSEAKTQAQNYLRKHYRSYRLGNHRVIKAYTSFKAAQKRVSASWRYHGYRYNKTVLVTKRSTGISAKIEH